MPSLASTSPARGPLEQTRPILRLDAREITQSLGGCRAGAEFLARCPAHDDRTPSLSIRDVGCRVLVHCHAGCGQDAVINALATRGLWPGSTSDELRNVLPLARPSHANGSSDNGTRIATALRLWGECEDPDGAVVERYLNNRELALDGAMTSMSFAFTGHAHSAATKRASLHLNRCLSRTIPRRPLERSSRSFTRGSQRGRHEGGQKDDRPGRWLRGQTRR